MTTKTITITEDAYSELLGLKLPAESFSEAIKRLSKSKGSLRDCLGLWKDLSSDEKKHIEKAVAAGKQTTQKIIGKLHGHTA